MKVVKRLSQRLSLGRKSGSGSESSIRRDSGPHAVMPPEVSTDGFLSSPEGMSVFVSSNDGSDYFEGSALKVEMSADDGETWVTIWTRDLEEGDRFSATQFSVKDHIEPNKVYLVRGYQRDSTDGEWKGPGRTCRYLSAPAFIPRMRVPAGPEYDAQRVADMTTYKDRFDAMVQELRDTDGVHVVKYETFPGIEDSELDAIYEKLGYRLHETITSFFKQTNGVDLRWKLSSNEKATKQLESRESSYSEVNFDGMIQIPPLDELVFTDYEDQLYFDFMKDDEDEEFMGKMVNPYEFAKSLRPIDTANFYDQWAFVLDGRPDPVVLMLTSHGADHNSSYATDFHSYVEFAIASKCLLNRKRAFYRSWRAHDKHPPLLTTKDIFPQNFVDFDAIKNAGSDLQLFEHEK